MNTEKNGRHSRSPHYNDQWRRIEPRKDDVEIGDVVFSTDGDCGIVSDVRYNEADEVTVDWITTTHKTARTSLAGFSRVVRITRIEDLEKGLHSLGQKLDELRTFLLPGLKKEPTE